MRQPRLFFYVLALLLTANCSSNTSSTTGQDESWPAKMQKTAASFKEILPYVYNEKAFVDPKNSKELQAKIYTFSKSIHTLPKDQARKFIGDDPFLLTSIQQLQGLADRARISFDKGQKPHAQRLLKTAAGHCFKCHTRMPYGPDSLYWKDLDISKIDGTPVEKSQLYVAMRQYDKAKDEIKKYLSGLEQQTKFNIEYENGLKYYLMIALRGQNSFAQAQQMVESKLNNKALNSHFRNVLKTWKSDLAYWSNKKANSPNNLGTAKTLLKRGGATMKSQIYSDENFIKRLIASSIIHQSLNEPNLTKQVKAESYYYLGSIYDSLLVASYWDLPELYYEMCIKYQPGTKMAKQCYSKLEEDIVVGYSGSRGTFVPADEKARLNELKKMAEKQ